PGGPEPPLPRGQARARRDLRRRAAGARPARPPGPNGAALLRPARVGRVLTGRVPVPGEGYGSVTSRPRSGQRRGDPFVQRGGAAAAGGRREARRLQPREAPSRGGLVARAPRIAAAPARDAGGRARAAAAADRRLPLLLRADARPEVAAVSDPPRDRQEERLPL